MRRIERNRVEKDIAPDSVAQGMLHLRHVGRYEGADFFATGVNEVDQGDLVLDQVVVEPDGLPVLGHERQVRDVGGAPRRGGHRRDGERSEEGLQEHTSHAP